MEDKNSIDVLYPSNNGIYPDIKSWVIEGVHGKKLHLKTFIRKQYKKVWYLQEVYAVYILEGYDFDGTIRLINSFHHNVYAALAMDITEITLSFCAKDKNQIPERERLMRYATQSEVYPTYIIPTDVVKDTWYIVDFITKNGKHRSDLVKFKEFDNLSKSVLIFSSIFRYSPEDRYRYDLEDENKIYLRHIDDIEAIKVATPEQVLSCFPNEKF
jgi:hypothetical protein